jgi:hypothetical protein
MVGKLTLRRFNGIEIYAVSKASYMLLGDAEEEDLRLNFEFEVDDDCLERTNDDTAEHNPLPAGEISIYANDLDLDSLAGRSFDVKSGNDDENGEFIARLYYFEHEFVDDNVVNVLSRAADGGFHVKWTGRTADPFLLRRLKTGCIA